MLSWASKLGYHAAAVWSLEVRRTVGTTPEEQSTTDDRGLTQNSTTQAMNEKETAGNTDESATAASDHAWLTGSTARAPRSASNVAANTLRTLLQDPQAVRKLSPPQLHHIVSNIGLTDAVELLEVATPQQVRDTIDLQVWKHDRADSEELLDWVFALVQLPQEVAERHIQAIDVELLGFLLRSRMNIYLAREDEAPEEPEGTFYQTPDQQLILDLLDEESSRVDQVINVVEALYTHDADSARRLLANLMWEVSSELEEWSLRWRNARLQDMGFSDPLEALQIYAYLDPAKVSPEEDSADRPLRVDTEPITAPEPSALLATGEVSFWSDAMETVTDPAEKTRLGAALMALTNMNLSADHVDPADEQGARQSMEHLRGRLSIGLEHLCEADVQRAPAILQHIALIRLARLGHSLILDQQHRLLPLLRQGELGRAPRKLDLLDFALQDHVGPLMAPRPRFLEPGATLRPFRSKADIAVAAKWVDQVILSAQLVPRDSWPVGELPAPVTLAGLFCTEVANRVLGTEGPTTRQEIKQLIKRIDAGRFGEPATRAATALAAERLGRTPDVAANTLMASWLDDLAQTLGPLDPETLDLRFIHGLHTAEDGTTEYQ